MKLRLIADDLTGALDAAAPFARPGRPVRLGTGPEGEAATHSTESRDLPEAAALARVRAAMAAMAGMRGAGPDMLWFKKVDSVLRGHPFAETVAMMREGGFRRCIFAPAFPGMGRITRAGRQLVCGGDGAWQETGRGDLGRAFARIAPGAEIRVVDAESQEDLRRAVLPWRDLPDTLWAGSRGLAEALAPPVVPLAAPPVGLFVLGTAHPATRAQARALEGLTSAAEGPGLVPETGRPLLLDPVPESPDAGATAAALRRALARLAPPRDGSALFVTGGDCLSLVLAATGADTLECIGEAAPGLPVSRLIGGRFDGVVLVSKSGGFGGPGLLRDFVRR